MPRAMLAALLTAFMLGSGCGNDADTGTSILSVIPDENFFHLMVSAPDGGFSTERTYQWRCTAGRAEIIFDSGAESTGTIHFALRDSFGRTVYENTCTDPRGSFTREDTGEAFPGTWSACIHIVNFKGSATISAAAK